MTTLEKMEAAYRPTLEALEALEVRSSDFCTASVYEVILTVLRSFEELDETLPDHYSYMRLPVERYRVVFKTGDPVLRPDGAEHVSEKFIGDSVLHEMEQDFKKNISLVQVHDILLPLRVEEFIQ